MWTTPSLAVQTPVPQKQYDITRVFYLIWYHNMISYMASCDITYILVMSYRISYMISLHLDPLPGPVPAENGLQGKTSEPKFRWSCFDQHVQICASQTILVLWRVVLCSRCVRQIHSQASKVTQVPLTSMPFQNSEIHLLDVWAPCSLKRHWMHLVQGRQILSLKQFHG